MKTLAEKLKKWACIDLFRTACLLFSAYFFYSFHTLVGFPPSKPIDVSSGTYLFLSIVFLLLPSAKSIKFGKWFEYEAKVTALKDEVNQFKDETRQLLSVQSSLISAVSNTITQSINITLPGQQEIEQAKEELNSAIEHPKPNKELEDQVDQFLLAGGSDPNFALARLRMELEKELRRILEKRIDTPDPRAMKGKFYSARSLFQRFVEKFPNYRGMQSSFDYILRICNAAIHGQNISQDYSYEALHMGLKMLDELRMID